MLPTNGECSFYPLNTSLLIDSQKGKVVPVLNYAPRHVDVRTVHQLDSRPDRLSPDKGPPYLLVRRLTTSQSRSGRDDEDRNPSF
jgi:hypothetical protein